MRYALLIGNDRYDDSSWSPLKSPSADVRAMAELLQDKTIGAFDEVTPLTNRTGSEIRSILGTFVTGKRHDDLILLYFSGHGDVDDSGDLILALRDTWKNNISGTGLEGSYILKQMDRCYSKRQVLIVDSCYSAAIDPGRHKGTEGKPVVVKTFDRQTFEGDSHGSGRVILTSSDRAQFAREGEQVLPTRLSLFTHFLVQGLRTGEAARGNQEEITLDELFDYIYAKVTSTPAGQTPTKYTSGEQGRFVIARNPCAKPKTVEPMQGQSGPQSLSPNLERAIRNLGLLLRGNDPALVAWARAQLKDLKHDDNKAVAALAKSLLAQARIPATGILTLAKEKARQQPPLQRPKDTEQKAGQPAQESIADRQAAERWVNALKALPPEKRASWWRALPDVSDHPAAPAPAQAEGKALDASAAAGQQLSKALRRIREADSDEAPQKPSETGRWLRAGSGLIMGIMVIACLDAVITRILGFPKTTVASGDYESVYQAFPWFRTLSETLAGFGLAGCATLGWYYENGNWSTVFWTALAIALIGTVLAISI